METRLVIAYSLLAIMAALALFGVAMFLKKRTKLKRRDAGYRDV